MPVYKAEEIHKILREQRGYFLDCWAESILTRYKTKAERNACLDRMYKKRLGPKEVDKKQADEFIKNLRERILRVWESKKALPVSQS